MHVVKSEGVNVIFDLLREAICKPRESAHSHTHRQVLPLDETGGNMLFVRVAANSTLDRSAALARAVAPFFFVAFGIAIYFLQHGIVNLAPKGAIYGGKVRPVSIRG